MDSDLCARYRVLQQEADFALWRVREANMALRERYAKALRSDGSPPGDTDLGDLRRLESDAEEKYRQLREFLRSAFDDARAVPR